MDYYELTVKSALYGETCCVVDIAAFQNGRKIFCCGDGCDYRLSKRDIRKVIGEIRKHGQRSYEDMRIRHSKEFNEFPMAYAFDNEQFAEGMRKLGLNPDDTHLVFKHGNTGAFYRRSDSERLKELLGRQGKEHQDSIDGDLNGDGYIYGMFHYHLCNHEYTYAYDPEDTLNALGLSMDDINKNPKFLYAFNEATAALRKQDSA